MTDNIDDILDEDGRVEARFRDLEVEAKIEEMRRTQGVSGSSSTRQRSDDAPLGGDPLADMKASLDGSGDTRPSPVKDPTQDDVDRYVLAVCPHCDAKNRISLRKLRSGDPKCGRCKKALAFTRA